MTFPGTIYDAQGRNLDGAAPTLRQDQVDACPHQSMVSDRDAPQLARVWLLSNGATFDAIPALIVFEAVQMILAGKSILLLAERDGPEVDVREGLLTALDLFHGGAGCRRKDIRAIVLQVCRIVLILLTCTGIALVPMLYAVTAAGHMLYNGPDEPDWFYPLFLSLPVIPLPFLWLSLWLVARLTKPKPSPDQ